MPQATEVTLDAHSHVDFPSTPASTRAMSTTRSWPDIRLSLYDDLAAIEKDWRAFEEHADCTVFQTFDWLATWQRHIGTRHGVTPAIVVGRHEGQIIFLLPLAVEPGGFARRVTWLGSYLCNYNGPLLARDFADRVTTDRFVALWHEITKLLRCRLNHDLVDLEKMPATIGAQVNPFAHVGMTPHVNDAYLTHLSGGWETFYAAKRSGSTRKRDRKKRKHLAEHGDVAFVTAVESGDIARTLDALIEEKNGAYARMGVANMFEWPGYREFFHDMANHPRLVHVCRLDVGAKTVAANFGLTFRDTYYYVLAGYDNGELAKFGPGMALLHDLLRYSIEAGLKIFDFTIGDEGYKREWLDTETRLYDCVTPATWRGTLIAMPLATVRRVKRRIKQDPTLWARVRKLRTVVGPLLKRSPR